MLFEIQVSENFLCVGFIRTEHERMLAACRQAGADNFPISSVTIEISFPSTPTFRRALPRATPSETSTRIAPTPVHWG